MDAEFFPDDAALFNDPSSQDHPSIIWKRPSEFCKGEIRVFSDSIVPCDIHQGALGDCWYLAALAALAEQPELIRGLFSSEHHSSVGVYEVVCFKNLGRPLGHFFYFPLTEFKRIVFRNIFLRVLRAILGMGS